MVTKEQIRRPRDSQRSAVYRWEKALWATYGLKEDMLSLEECQAMVGEVWGDFVTHPNLRCLPPVVNGRGTTWAWGGMWEVSLPRWARFCAVVVHEVGHGVIATRTFGKEQVAPHGPEFASLLVELLEKYCDVPSWNSISCGEKQRPRRVRFG